MKWLAQGTIYPDCIESLSITGTVIKSHHNVGGLPEKMNLKLCEPLRLLFKDEVRRVGRELGMPEHLITRHPFPGPGLAVRILVILLLKKYVFCRMLMISLFRDCVTGDCMIKYGRQELSCCQYSL